MTTQTPSNELTHRIIGVLYETYNSIGFGFQEKHYYRAIKLKLLKAGFKVQEQLLCRISVDEKIIGRYFLDFLVDGKIVLEIKVANAVYPAHIKQVLHYLRVNNLKLGLIAVFSKTGVIIKRVIN